MQAPKHSNIITNGGSLGVEGINVPISGSLSGRGRNGMYYTVDMDNGRTDLMQPQVTTSDLAEKIKNLEAL